MKDKLNQKIKEEALSVEKVVAKARKIYGYRVEKGLDFNVYNSYSASINYQNAMEKFKVIEKMHLKYRDVLEYFRES